MKPDQLDTIRLVNNIFSGVSVASIAVFICLSLKGNKSSPIRALIRNMMLSNLVLAIANLLSNLDYLTSDNTICVIEGALRQFASVSSLLWAVILAFGSFSVVVNCVSYSERRMRILQTTILIISLVFTLIPFTGLNGMRYSFMLGVCWIVSETEAQEDVNFIALLLGWAWLAMLLMTYWYLRLYLFLKNNAIFMGMGLNLKAQKLFIYPLALMITYVPLTLFRLVFVDKSETSFKWNLIYIVTRNLNSLINVVVYGYQNHAPQKSIPVSRGSSTENVLYQENFDKRDFDVSLHQVEGGQTLSELDF